MGRRRRRLARGVERQHLHRFPGPPRQHPLPPVGRAPSPSSCTPSTHRASPSRGRSSPCWRTTSRRTVRYGFPARSRRTSGPTGSSPVPSARAPALRARAGGRAGRRSSCCSASPPACSSSRHFRRDAASASRLYAGVFAGLNDPRPGAEASALLRLGEHVRELGMPLVVTDRTGRVTAFANVPFPATLDDPRAAGIRRAARCAEPAGR